MSDELEASTPSEDEASETTPAAPSAPSVRFVRELTPIWLATTALLAQQEPPDLTRPFRYVHLGCGTGETAAVVAACHPHAEVWAWDRRPESLESTRRLRDAADLTNLTVHERIQLPPDLGGESADIVVVQEILASVGDGDRRRIADFVGAVARPGALVCVTYPSLVGWSEIVPVQALMRRIAHRASSHPRDAVPEVLDLLVHLRDGGAAYLTDRPIVKAWLDELLELDPQVIADQYLRDEFRPLSPAQVSDLLRPLGCDFVGSARLTDDLGLDLPTELLEAVNAAPSSLLRETYLDLSTRRAHHFDVFRFGDAPLTADDAAARIGALPVTGATIGDTTVADLDSDAEAATVQLRVLMDAGEVHPVVAPSPGARADASCAALNAALLERSVSIEATPQRASAIDLGAH